MKQVDTDSITSAFRDFTQNSGSGPDHTGELFYASGELYEVFIPLGPSPKNYGSQLRLRYRVP